MNVKARELCVLRLKFNLEIEGQIDQGLKDYLDLYAFTKEQIYDSQYFSGRSGQSQGLL